MVDLGRGEGTALTRVRASARVVLSTMILPHTRGWGRRGETTARTTRNRHTAAYLLLQSLRSRLYHVELFAHGGESGLVRLMMGWRKVGGFGSGLWGKVEERGGGKMATTTE